MRLHPPIVRPSRSSYCTILRPATTQGRAGRRLPKATQPGIEPLEQRLLLADMTGPLVQDLRLVADRLGINQVVVVFDEALAPATATNPTNYGLRSAGKDKRFGTADDRTVPLQATMPLTYEANSFTATLRPAAPLALNQFFQITINGTSSVTDVAGNRLDGNADGTPGGNYVASFGRGTKLSYLDHDGDTVSLSLKSGGTLEVIRRIDGEGRIVRVVDAVPGRSSLSGSVKRAKKPPIGDGVTTIGAVVAAGAANRLTAAFQVLPDNDPPIVTLSTAPAPNLVTNGNVTLAGRAFDLQSGLAAVQATVDGGPFSNGSFDALGSFQFDTTFPLNGTADSMHTVTLRAIDRAGQTRDAGPFGFTLDTTPPAQPAFDLAAASDTPPAGDQQTTLASVTLTGQTSANTQVELLPGTAITASDAAGRFEFTGVSLAVGTNDFTARATDAAGNQSTFQRTITRVAGPPTVMLAEGTTFVVEATQPVVLGQTEGTRKIEFDVAANFDTTDNTAAVEDLLLVYLVDPADPSHTLLDRGSQGSAIFALGGTSVEFLPGAVQFDGTHVTIDVTSLGNLTSGLLRFQLINSDSDTGTQIDITGITSVADPAGSAPLAFDTTASLAAPGAALDPATLTASSDVRVLVQNVRFDSATKRYTAEVRLHNTGASIGRSAIASFSGLPAGVELVNRSGTDAAGMPYVNFTRAIARGGLGQNTESLSIELVFDDPSVARFALHPQVLIGGSNRAPVLNAIDPVTIMPGNRVEIPLSASDPDGDPVTFSIPSDVPLPTGMLRADGVLELMPQPDDLGTYTIDVVATDGALDARRAVTVNVVADPVTTTRVSGQVLQVNGQPLANMMVEIGAVQGLTSADGSFTLDLGSGPVVSDTIKVRGELFAGPLAYPFIGEKLVLLLEHDVFLSVNNVISRPIFLPALDVANGKQIDPMQDTLVTTAAIPGASVFVAAGTLMNQQGTPFTGVLSITEVPTSLTPAALPEELHPDLVVTIQPGEMVFAAPAPLSLPNGAGFPPGTMMDLWSINPVSGQFDKVGTGVVSADGSTIDTVSGGIRNSSWHIFIPPPPVASGTGSGAGGSGGGDGSNGGSGCGGGGHGGPICGSAPGALLRDEPFT